MSGLQTRSCYYCHKGPEVDEMRPYGPGGAWIHFDCMKADPAREQTALNNFHALLDAAHAAGGGVAAIGEKEGPRPLPLRDITDTEPTP